jgi:hypothetical protein
VCVIVAQILAKVIQQYVELIFASFIEALPTEEKKLMREAFTLKDSAQADAKLTVGDSRTQPQLYWRSLPQSQPRLQQSQKRFRYAADRKK